MKQPFQRKLLVRRRSGRWELKLGAAERELLASLAEQLDELIATDPDDPGLARLFPPAYPDDIAHEAEWQVFKAGELRSGLQEHLAVLKQVAERTELDPAELQSWMRSINALRLVLGTRLDVSEDDDVIEPEATDAAEDDPDAGARAVYSFLSYLLDRTVDAMSNG